jgi:hypothetical protein
MKQKRLHILFLLLSLLICGQSFIGFEIGNPTHQVVQKHQKKASNFILKTNCLLPMIGKPKKRKTQMILKKMQSIFFATPNILLIFSLNYSLQLRKNLLNNFLSRNLLTIPPYLSYSEI